MGSISIVGLGPEPSLSLAEETLERLKTVSRVIVPTGEVAAVGVLEREGIDASTLADVGLSASAPLDQVIESLVELSQKGDVAYASSGYPFLRERLIASLLLRTGREVEVYPSPSLLQLILMAFDIDLTADLDIVDIANLKPGIEQRNSHLIVTGIRNPVLIRKAAERLADVYPADHGVVLASPIADDAFSLALHSVVDLPEVEIIGEAALYVSPSKIASPAGFDEFVRLISVLRGPDGCPWDRAQDHASLRRHMLEEAYEAVAAIEAGSDEDIADELGDVLLQVVLHAQIASEEDRFDVDDIVARISAKIRRRHPHVFGDAVAKTPDEVHERWDSIKRSEKDQDGLLDGIPRALPALIRAQKISRRAVGVGFEWDTLDDVWEKFHEEVDELKATEPGSEEAAEEIGDILFTLVNVARKQGIDAEEALRGTCEKFISRWEHMEKKAASRGLEMEDMDIKRLEELWQYAKANES